MLVTPCSFFPSSKTKQGHLQRKNETIGQLIRSIHARTVPIGTTSVYYTAIKVLATSAAFLCVNPLGGNSSFLCVKDNIFGSRALKGLSCLGRAFSSPFGEPNETKFNFQFALTTRQKRERSLVSPPKMKKERWKPHL